MKRFYVYECAPINYPTGPCLVVDRAYNSKVLAAYDTKPDLSARDAADAHAARLNVTYA